jgi:hypothetical protein
MSISYEPNAGPAAPNRKNSDPARKKHR